MVRMSRLTAVVRLRRKSQLTMPAAIVAASGLRTGDRLVVEVAVGDPDTIMLRRVRPSHGGTVGGVYGATEEYLRAERGSWNEAEPA